MRYRVYSGPRGAEAVSAMEKDRLLFKECATLDEALNWARHATVRAVSRCGSRATTAPR